MILDRDDSKSLIMSVTDRHETFPVSVRVVCSAEAPPASLFATVCDEASVTDENRMLMSDLGIDNPQELGTIFSGEEELFAFDRTVSRLNQMQTLKYWEQTTHEHNN